MKYGIFLLSAFLIGCGEGDLSGLDQCDGSIYDEIHTLSWKHDQYGEPGVSYTVYFDSVPIVSQTQATATKLETTELSMAIDPMALGFVKCSRMFFRVVAHDTRLFSQTSPFSNEVSDIMSPH